MKLILNKVRYQSSNCGKIIKDPKGIAKPVKCPKCSAMEYMIHRLDLGSPRENGRRPQW